VVKPEHSEIRGWATRLAAGDDPERRAAGRALLMLLDDLARTDAELEAARAEALRATAALEAVEAEAAEAAQAAADEGEPPPTFWDRLLRRPRE
jgi:hypothetical protein